MNDKVLIDKFGFREYDARWIYKRYQQSYVLKFRKGLGSQIIKHTKKNNPRIVVNAITDLTARKLKLFSRRV